jgi:hypothetical protein
MNTAFSTSNQSGGDGLLTVQLLRNRHKRLIASHFHSVALELFYLGEDLDEADK